MAGHWSGDCKLGYVEATTKLRNINELFQNHNTCSKCYVRFFHHEAIGNTNMGIENDMWANVWRLQGHVILFYITKMITSSRAILKWDLPSVIVAQQLTSKHRTIA